jgi:hypothetical protein
MPTIELYGHSAEGAERMMARCRELLAGLPFCADIVFVDQGPSRVIGWDGSDRPFVRVLTRSPARAGEIRDRLTGETDLEVVLIDFIPRASRP